MTKMDEGRFDDRCANDLIASRASGSPFFTSEYGDNVQRRLGRPGLRAKENRCAIQREPRKARNIVLPGRKARLIDIPIFGTIPAGHPSDQQQESYRCISIDPDSIHLPRNARTFALQVRGDSMKDAAIVEGDVVIMEFCEPRSGDIVAALIDGETTLKRYLVQRGKPFLRAENPKYPDLIPAQELVIQGVFRALIRTDKRRV